MKDIKITIVKYLKLLVKRPELLFAVLGLVFGMLFIFRLAPLSGTDEFTHFPRLYQISEGTFWEQKLPGNQYGGKLPSNVNNMINDYRNLSRYPTGSSYLQGREQLNAKYASISNPGSRKVTAYFTSVVIYPPWAYFPSLIGLFIAKGLGLGLIWYVYLSRITNFIVWLILGYFAIKLIPSGKWFLLVLALTPTAISQGATIGGDGILMGLAWLLIAAVIRLAVSKDKVKFWWLPVLLFLAAYTALIKDGYFLVGLAPLAIPLERFKTRAFGIGFKLINAIGILVIALLFTLRTVHAVHGVVLTPTIGMNLNSSQQISYMIHHVLSYGLHVVEEPFTKVFDTTYLGIVGIITNRLIYMSILVIGTIYLCLAAAYIKAEPIKQLSIKLRSSKWIVGLFIVIFYLTYLLLASAFYIGNTSVGATFVNGFYGRYFLPIMPLLLIIPLSIRRSNQDRRYLPLTVIGSVIGLIAMIFSLQ